MEVDEMVLDYGHSWRKDRNLVVFSRSRLLTRLDPCKEFEFPVMLRSFPKGTWLSIVMNME
ncbi:unnamed protein product, partial [Amoebophrya sp. A25]|eukprot:GSA25T00018019001.1